MFYVLCVGVSTFRYIMRIINPKRKSDIMTRTWHNVHERFASPDVLRQAIVTTFAEQVPESDNFSVGYYEKPGNSKRWIATKDDLDAMYRVYGNDTINLWCEGRADVEHPKKRDNSDDRREQPANKRLRKEKDVDDIFEILHDKHSEKYSDPQLRLWARMYLNGIHNDLDTPPNVPAITGRVAKRKESHQSLAEALTGAATAVTKVLVNSTPQSSPSKSATGISPSSKANLSGQYLQQLRTLQQLREAATLTEEEFQEQKCFLLKNIKGLNAV